MKHLIQAIDAEIARLQQARKLLAGGQGDRVQPPKGSARLANRLSRANRIIKLLQEKGPLQRTEIARLLGERPGVIYWVLKSRPNLFSQTPDGTKRWTLIEPYNSAT